MTLSRVCIWENGHWELITAEEAHRRHPKGASANSGLFMCDYCGQYVTLATGPVVKPYFRHSRGEDDKSCPERTFGDEVIRERFIKEKHLPLRLVLTEDYNDKLRIQRLEIGIIQIPDELLQANQTASISIYAYRNNKMLYSRQYSIERLLPTGTTYFDAGIDAPDCFAIELRDASTDLRNYLPSMVSALTDSNLFDAYTGKMLPKDADVVVNRKYILITTGFISNTNAVHAVRILSPFNRKAYMIWAEKYSEEAARFFLEHHARLTDVPMKFTPIWPPVVRSQHIILHKGNYVYFFEQGYLTNEYTYPSTFIHRQPILMTPYVNLLKVGCSSRQQFISLGRSNVLKYEYLWQEELERKTELPTIKVTDLQNNMLDQDEYEKIQKNTVFVEPQLDVAAYIYDQNRNITYISNMKAESRYRVTLPAGGAMKIYAGMDCIRCIALQRPIQAVKHNHADICDEKLYQALGDCKGNEIFIAHTFGVLAENMNGYPLCRTWLLKRIRQGKISADAKHLLQETFATRKEKTD